MKHLLPLAAVTLLASTAAAQTFYTFPAGTETEWGGTGNTIPFWGGSATYQQVMDHKYMSELNSGNVIVMTEMFFRARSNIKGRSATVELKFNHTSVDAASATTTFATNLQGPGDAAPTTVLPYTAINFPAFSSSFSSGMSMPLKTPYIWTPGQNKNFAYELRYKDGSPGSQTGSLDAIDGNSFTSTRRPSEGVACTASDKTSPSRAMSTLAFASGSSSFPAWNYTVSLSNARSNARAVWFLGLTRQKIALPGACSNLELSPIYTQFGTTTKDATGPKPIPGGNWDIHIPVPQTPDYRLLPRFELLSQFAYDDPAMPYSLGVSDMTVVKTNFPAAVGVARIYSFTSSAGNGSETATSGSKGMSYGLVTGFR